MIKSTYLVALAGLVWAACGIALFNKGLGLVKESMFFYPLICLGLIIGFLKASSVLRKAAEKTASRLLETERGTVFHLFNFRYIVLIAVMMGLGFLMRSIGLSPEARGTIDVAIGSALFTASFFYFRFLKQAAAKSI